MVQLARQPGRKEHRYAQLLGGALISEESETPVFESGTSRQDRLALLEEEVAGLKGDVITSYSIHYTKLYETPYGFRPDGEDSSP